MRNGGLASNDGLSEFRIHTDDVDHPLDQGTISRVLVTLLPSANALHPCVMRIQRLTRHGKTTVFNSRRCLHSVALR